MNYYQIHKNKRPKKLRNRKADLSLVFTALVAAMGAMSIATTSLQVFKSPELKRLLVFKESLDASVSVINVLDSKRMEIFKKTGRYNFRKGEFKNRKLIKENHKKVSNIINELICKQQTN